MDNSTMRKKSNASMKSGLMVDKLKALQNELYDLKEQMNEAYNHVVELTGEIMLMNCNQEEGMPNENE